MFKTQKFARIELVPVLRPEEIPRLGRSQGTEPNFLTVRELLLEKVLNRLPSLRGLVETVQPFGSSLPRSGQNHAQRLSTGLKEVPCPDQIPPKLAQDLIWILGKKEIYN